MIKIYLSYRSQDFRKELYYRELEEVKENCSWRTALKKWERVQRQIADHDYIRIAVIDETKRVIIAYVDLRCKEVIAEQIPPQEDLFE